MNWHEYFTYDGSTGNLIWKNRPRAHFTSDRGWQTFNGAYALKVAGHQFTHTGHRAAVQVRVNGKILMAHRIIWEMHNGPIPTGLQVDHKNCDPWNNSLANLRLATHAENQRNCKIDARNTSGFKGVHWDAKNRKWRAAIGINRRTINLGRFDTPEKAHDAYREAALSHHGAFARLT